MIIGEARFAAALVDENNGVYKFDDIGCMQNFIKKNNSKPNVAWVHDFQTEEWLNLNQAILTHSEKTVTPMGSGIIARKNPPKSMAD